MASENQSPGLHNPAPKIWFAIAMVFIASFVIGFLVLGRYQQDAPALGVWAAICRAIGIGGANDAGGLQPPVQTPTRIAWTPATLAQIAAGNARHGAVVAQNCVACHGEHGVSSETLIPTLAGMNAAVIYKQLDDYRAQKRLWGVMGAIASALSAADSADVAVLFRPSPRRLAADSRGGRAGIRAQPAAA